MPASHHDRHNRDVLQVTARELRDRIQVRIDRELIDTLDRHRRGLSRSQYLELVLRAAFAREHPHLPEHWTAEDAAREHYARALRYLQSGR